MCRNIRRLYNFLPPVTEDEIEAASLQFVRKVSGFASPSQINRDAFNRAVREISAATQNLLEALQSNARPLDRAEEAAKARARSARRFG